MAFVDITPNFNMGTTAETLTHVSTTAQLDNRTYRFDFYTNKADDTWYLDVSSQNGNLLIIGIGLAAGIDLLYPYRYLDVPPGKLFVNPQGPDGYVDPTLDAFVQGYAAIWYEEATG